MSVNAISMRRGIFGEGSLVETLLGRILVCVVFTCLVAAVLILLFLVNRVLPPVALKYALLVAIGLSSGFAARRLLPGRNLLIQLITAFLSLFTALSLVNVPTQGFVGINSLRAYLNRPAWDGALGLGVAFVMSMMALRVRARTRAIGVEPRYRGSSSPVPLPPPRRPSPPRRTSRRAPSSVRNGNGRSPRSAGSSWMRLNAFLPAAPRTRTPRRTVARPAKTKPRRRGLFSRPGVAFSGTEQHVCPYCLERVIRNDPRGVKICKVCKTWHHADCWDITGVCQVPHQYVG